MGGVGWGWEHRVLAGKAPWRRDRELGCSPGRPPWLGDDGCLAHPLWPASPPQHRGRHPGLWGGRRRGMRGPVFHSLLLSVAGRPGARGGRGTHPPSPKAPPSPVSLPPPLGPSQNRAWVTPPLPAAPGTRTSGPRGARGHPSRLPLRGRGWDWPEVSARGPGERGARGWDPGPGRGWVQVRGGRRGTWRRAELAGRSRAGVGPVGRRGRPGAGRAERGGAAPGGAEGDTPPAGRPQRKG